MYSLGALTIRHAHSLHLIAAVASLIIAAIMWAYGTTTGNWQFASKDRAGVLIALGTAAAAGAGVAVTNWLIHLGGRL